MSASALVSVLLLLGACGSGGGDSRSGPEPTDTPEIVDGVVSRHDVIDVDGVYPFRPDGRYASVLAACALATDADDACPLATLPFLVQQTPSPSVEDVMERVLVTHDWMGSRFETLLASRSAELLPLFGSITSITIGSTVRPSSYRSRTGGIRLDPDRLWLTVGEKANVSIEEDYRTPFRRLLAFRNYSSSRIDGRSIFGSFRLDDTTERTFDDIELPTMSLLFHELAHAIDYLPPGAAPLLDPALTPRDALDGIEELRLSRSLQARQPLTSELLRSLARVRFRGETPTDAQAAVSADVAGAEMAFDGATGFYNYHTIREDFANLFETVQMKRLFDVDENPSFTVQPADPDDFDCDELLVGWGVLNRLGDASVQARARDVVESIYGPDPTLDGFLAAQLGTEVPMEVGVDLCTNLDRALPAGAARTREDPWAHPLGPPLTHAERHALEGDG